MKTPSLKEVKEYFKDAKEVRFCNSTVIGELTTMNFKRNGCGGINEYDFSDKDLVTYHAYHCVYSDGNYAEIISYKTKTYTVDETFIKEAYESACPTWKDKLKEKFPNAFKSELEVNRWYWLILDSKHDLIYVKSIEDFKVNYYGFFNGKWENGDWANVNNNFKLATEQEVFEALKNEANKRGFKEGNYKCLDLPNYTEKAIDSYFYDEGKLFKGKPNSANVVFDNGTWAEIIKETEVSLTDLIECYKKTNNIDNLKVV